MDDWTAAKGLPAITLLAFGLSILGLALNPIRPRTNPLQGIAPMFCRRLAGRTEQNRPQTFFVPAFIGKYAHKKGAPKGAFVISDRSQLT